LLANVYLNWKGTTDEFARVKTIVKDLAAKAEGIKLEGLFIPNNKWNYAVVYKFDRFGNFLEFQREVRTHLKAQNLEKIPDRELVILIEEKKLY
jgi:hypothetical protein